MTSLRTTPPSTRRVVKIVATLVAIVVALFVVDTLRGDGDESATTLSTQALLTLPSDDEPTPTAVPTTAPVQLPTATPDPTPTAVPTATAEPTPTVAPTSPPTTAPAPSPTAAVAVADAGSGSTALDTDNTEGAEPTTERTPAADDIAAPTEAPATVAPTAEPTAEPTIAPPPTATSEPIAESTPEPTPTNPPTPTPVPPQTVAQLENYVLGEINRVRANAGLSPVVLDPTISAISRDWSQQMALGGFFSHRPSADLNVMLPSGWLQWGENIASAPDIYYAQSSLENSPGHYENMVGPFTHVGIGVYTNGTQVWLTHNFARY